MFSAIKILLIVLWTQTTEQMPEDIIILAQDENHRMNDLNEN